MRNSIIAAAAAGFVVLLAGPALADKGGVPNSHSNGHGFGNVKGAPVPLIGAGAPLLIAGAGIVANRLRRRKQA